MKFRLFLSLLAIIVLSGVLVQAQNKDEKAIRTAIDAMTAAQVAYDAAALDKLFTADYIEISPAGEFDPRAKVLTFYAPTEKEKLGGVNVVVSEDFRSVRIYGDTAVAIVEMTFTMSKDGKAFPPRKMMATIVCRKESGSWKIASTQYTGISRSIVPPDAAAK